MDKHCELLANVYRRRVLVVLSEQHSEQQPIYVPEDIHVGEKSIESLQLRLHHNHLPRLEDMGFIQWDQDSNEVYRGPSFDDIQPFLEVLEGHMNESLTALK